MHYQHGISGDGPGRPPTEMIRLRDAPAPPAADTTSLRHDVPSTNSKSTPANWPRALGWDSGGAGADCLSPKSRILSIVSDPTAGRSLSQGDEGRG
jgi:hypothetical protein